MQQNKNQVNSIILNVFVSVVYSKDRKATTAWKISKYGVFSSPYFPTLGLNSIANDANHSLNDLRYIYHSLKFFFEETKFFAFQLFHFMIQTISYIINLQPYSGHISVKSKWKACWEKNIFLEPLHEASLRGDLTFLIPCNTVPIKIGCVIRSIKKFSCYISIPKRQQSYCSSKISKRFKYIEILLFMHQEK